MVVVLPNLLVVFPLFLFAGHPVRTVSLKSPRRCGWWYVIENTNIHNENTAAVYVGILQRFDLNSATIPIQVLKAKLPENLKRIDGIHPKKMEDLLAHILSGVFDCDVHQLGYNTRWGRGFTSVALRPTGCGAGQEA
jgi:hypothetical protein